MIKNDTFYARKRPFQTLSGYFLQKIAVRAAGGQITKGGVLCAHRAKGIEIL